VTFLERLRAYLERVARSPEGLPFISIDVAVHRRHLLEKAYTQSPVGRERQTSLIPHESEFRAFLTVAAAKILEELAPDATSEQLADLIDRAMVQLFEVGPSPRRQVDAELGRIALSAWMHRHDDDALDGWRIEPRYAFETRLTQRQGARVKISRSGAMLLELPGVEAIRWLLALESVQSLGAHDDWRSSPDLVAALLALPRRHVLREEEELDGPRRPYSMASLRRLGALQVLKYNASDDESDYAWGYEVPERMMPLLEEIVRAQSTPFTVLARALLDDDLDRAMTRMNVEYARAVQESAAATTALQARMVVHELRNALAPAQAALSALARSLGEAASVEPVSKHLRRIEGGLLRAFGFAGQMLKAANLGDEPRAPFDVVEAVREAIASVATLLNGHLRFAPPEEGRVVLGPRARFVLAVVNLVRNAAQASAAGGATGRVEASFGFEGVRVLLHVDDDGPGVPLEQRRLIFEPGVALSGVGSGQGLALVQQVIEVEMGGAVTCESGPLGGARFTIDLPVHEP
jgi:signal transduction histidine kinase